MHPANIKQNSHGGDIIAIAKRLNCRTSDLFDLSSNLSPFGLIPGLTKELTNNLEKISYLPEIDNSSLLKIFEDKYSLETGQVLAGNGTTEFIFTLPKALKCSQALIVTPTYSDYQRACDGAGIKANNFPLNPKNDFFLNLDLLKNKLHGNELVFICNPNNPTGQLTESEKLSDFVSSQPDSTFLIDESYLPFVREKSLISMPIPENLYILSSASKIFGMPGLRLGYLVSTKSNLKKIASQAHSWNVNQLAQVAGKYLLQHGDHFIEETLQYIEQERSLFTQSLGKISEITVVKGDANFILCHLQGKWKADQLRQELLKHKIIIRDCSNFDNLSNSYFRVSLKDRETNNYFLKTLDKILTK